MTETFVSWKRWRKSVMLFTLKAVQYCFGGHVWEVGCYVPLHWCPSQKVACLSLATLFKSGHWMA